MDTFKKEIKYYLWSLLVLISFSIVYLEYSFGLFNIDSIFGFKVNPITISFLIAYFSLAIEILILEKYIPFEELWKRSDNQIIVDISHSASSKIMFPLVAYLAGLYGINILKDNTSGPYWISSAPMLVQIFVGLIILEFGLYWAHRLSHQFMFLWRLHSIHHAVERLWVINTGRFHFLNSLFSVLMSYPLLLIAGAPYDVIMFTSYITLFFGLLTHCNVDMKTHTLHYIFNTPGMHRWHHSLEIIDGHHEGHHNYGENLLIWDHIFGTYYNPNRRPTTYIGVSEEIPETFWGQLIYPFTKMKETNYEHRNFYKEDKPEIFNK